MEMIFGNTRDELRLWLEQHRLPAYRSDQVLQWVYGQKRTDFASMTNLPADLRDFLGEEWVIRQAQLSEVAECEDGTKKLLLVWPDGALTETVLISSENRRTVCISSQVGCPVGCAFCASGKEGLERSLTAAEMVEQVVWADDLLPPDQRVSHVVVMGMGEPLLNYDSVLKAVKIINAPWGLHIGARHITISTIGIPDKIRQLAREPIQVTLAVSLHAGDDNLRVRLVPWAKKYKLADIFAAVCDYYEMTHREVTLEYILLAGVNDSDDNANSLVRWCRQYRCNVNLINYNAVEASGFQPVQPEKVKQFMDQLTQGGVNVHLRRSGGSAIQAACGQLRLHKKPTKSE